MSAEWSDKRDECGCHRMCPWQPHACDVPCTWPDCLTDDEHADLIDAVDRELRGDA